MMAVRVHEQLTRAAEALARRPDVLEVRVFGSVLWSEEPNDLDLIVVLDWSGCTRLGWFRRFVQRYSDPLPLDIKLLNPSPYWPDWVTTVTPAGIEDTYCGDRPEEFFNPNWVVWRR